MGIFNFFSGNEGGFMDVISCTEKDYLVHKWSPGGEPNSSAKENAIRYGSTLFVNAGEAALLFYKQENGEAFDIVTGPANQTIQTANLPILTSLVGAAYGGNSPFVAQVYFFNLQKNIQIKFGIPYFDVYDNRFPDLGVPCAVRGSITFNVTDVAHFIKLYRLVNFELSDFENHIEDFFTRKIKSVILNVPADTGLPITHLERKLDEISTYTQNKLADELKQDFGINLKRIDISAIDLYDLDPNYLQLKRLTADQQLRFTDAKTDVEITNLDELARLQRRDIELNMEGKNFTMHRLNQQADILKAAAENLGSMSSINLSAGNSFNPLGVIAGMAAGNILGGQDTLPGGMPNSTPPPVPVQDTTWHIALNGEQSGPYTITQLKEFAATGQFTKLHHVWQQGMAGWETANDVNGLADIFKTNTPATPPPPPGYTINLNKKTD